MARRPAPRSVDAQLAALRDGTSIDVLREALRGKVGVVVEAACARAVGAGVLLDVVDLLPEAFERLAEDGARRDPTCRGKLEIARALHEVDHWDERVFARGAALVQREAAYGGAVDTAGGLRGICGLAHAHFGRPDALDVLAALLADADRSAREAAARGLAAAGRRDASALLRYKLLTGDGEPEVMASCFESLLSLTGGEAFAFVAAFLAAHDEPAELAAIALAASRLPDTVPALRAWSAAALPEQRRRVGYVALALTRAPEATVELLALIAAGDRPDALAAARALATFRDDPAIRRSLTDACAAHPDAAVRRELTALVA